MTAGRRHFQGALDVLLAADLGKVGDGWRLDGFVVESNAGDEGADGQYAAEVGDDRVERFHGDHVDFFDEGRFGRIRLRHKQRFDATRRGQRGHGQNAIDMTHAAIEAQLADHQAVVQAVGRNLARGRQHGQRNGQVIGGAFLAQIGRRQADGQAGAGEMVARVDDGAAHPFARLADGGIGEADNRHLRQPGGDVHFDFDGGSFQANQGTAGDTGEHNVPPLGET